LKLMNMTIFDPDRGYENFQACVAGFRYGGYIGPFLDEHGESIWKLNSTTQASPSCDACEINQVWPHEQKEHCVHYPDTNEGFKCTPYINGECVPPQKKPYVVGNGAPLEAKFLCGSDTESWAYIPKDTGDFYYAETAEMDLMQHENWQYGPNMAAPFVDVCPSLDVMQAQSPVNVRRN